MMVTELVFQLRKLVTMIMDKLDMSQWKEFKVVTLFDYYHGKRIRKRDRIEGDLPFLTAGKENQGVASYVAPSSVTVYNRCISIDMFGNCFYHDKPCSGDDNIYFLMNDDYSDNQYIFLAGVINAVTHNVYSYSGQFREGSLKKLVIKLPVTSSGEPDWQYMDSYIAKLTACAYQEVSLLKRGTEKAEPLKISDWKDFKVTDLYKPVVVHHKLRNQDINSVGNTPVYSSTTVNNGIYGYVDDKAEFIVDENHHYVVFGDQTRGLFIPQESFSVTDNIKVLQVSSDRSVNQLMFMNSVLHKRLPDLGYVRYWSVVKRMSIKLPVGSTGHPDWHYMDNYVACMKSIASQSLNKFHQILS